MSRGETIVLARVLKVPGKAWLEVIERLRGPEDLPAELRVAFRGANRMREPGTPAFEVHEGEQAFFILEPWLDSHGERPALDLYRPAFGYRSRIPLPAEGRQALLEAVRALVRYQDDADRVAAEGRLVHWLEGSNPLLVDIALEQAARFGLADHRWVPGLLRRSRDADPRRRELAATAMGLSLLRGRLHRPAHHRGAGGDSALAAQCHQALVRLARSDPRPEVRRTAVRQLVDSVFDVDAVLAAIAREDEDQAVRLEAATAIHRRRSKGGGENHRGSPFGG
ncbi:MAG: hypothetical protein Q9Q40_03470 [Acidobacteriota bacterium]|nr:hypothetical protein [Acidobacteriota bacterium]